MDAEQAMQELLEVSPQVSAAVIADRTGSPQASSFPGDDDRATRLADIGVRALDRADTARTELGREPVVQCEVATGEGNLFVVADEQRLVCAVTSAEPTVGLVFYDLKTALRTLREVDRATDSATAKAGRS